MSIKNAEEEEDEGEEVRGGGLIGGRGSLRANDVVDPAF